VIEEGQVLDRIQTPSLDSDVPEELTLQETILSFRKKKAVKGKKGSIAEE
jgi:hypothetical protein